jgi:hypothetical protein
MSKRYPNYQKIKSRRCYKVEEIASLLDIHKNTVRNWIKIGLSPIDKKRPVLIRGGDLKAFVRDRKEKRKKKCRPGELYCVRCRNVRKPEGKWAEYSSITDKTGFLKAICPVCGSIMNRLVSLKDIESVCVDIEVSFSE